LLTPLHVQDVCLASEQQCRYLSYENIDGKSVAFCLKHAPNYYRQIRRDMQYYGIDLDLRGDNCQGYLLLKYKEQGYDVDG
jgi:hypothetical protein